MLVTSYLIIILSLCKVNMAAAEIRKYVPGENVILDCNVITSNHTISWIFENKIIWSGDKFSTMSNSSERYEITEKMNLRIKNTNIHDEGKYTCLLSPPLNNGKYTVMLESEQIWEKKNLNSNHSSESDVYAKKTTVQTILTGNYTEDPDNVFYCHGNGQWIVYSLISVSILSAILFGLLCVLFYKYRKTHYNRSNTGIHNFVSEHVELNDNQHVYNIIDENQSDDLMHDQADDVATASAGTHSSGHSDDDFIQYEESEYLHPYHSLVPVIDTEKQDYEQIKVQNKEDVYAYDDTGRRTEQIRTQIHLVLDNRILSDSNCTSDDLKRADVCKKVCNTKSDNKDSGPRYHTNKPDQNITNVTQNCKPITDNISLD